MQDVSEYHPDQLENLRKQAKELLEQFRRGDATTIERFRAHHPNFPKDRICLADAQSVIAREQGYPSWPKMKASLERVERTTARQYTATVPEEWQAYISVSPLTVHGTPFYGVRDRFFGFSPLARVHWSITNLTDAPLYLEVNYRSPNPQGPGKLAFSVGYALDPRETRFIRDTLPVMSARVPSVFAAWMMELRMPDKRLAARHCAISTDPLTVSDAPDRIQALTGENSELAVLSVAPVWSQAEGNELEIAVENRSGVEKLLQVQVGTGDARKADGIDRETPIARSKGSFSEGAATLEPNQTTVFRVPYSMSSDAESAPALVYRLYEPVQPPPYVLRRLGLADGDGYHSRDANLVCAGLVDLKEAAARGAAVLPAYVPADQRANLIAETRSEHFLFRYRPDSYAARNIDSIVNAREVAYDTLKKMLEMDVPVTVTVDLYPDMEAKALGSKTVWTPANTVTNEHIAEVYNETYQCGDFHMLAHIFSFHFGGSVEGLCQPFADYCGSGAEVARATERVKSRLKGGAHPSIVQAVSSHCDESLVLIDYLLSRDLPAFKEFYVSTTRGEDLDEAAHEAYGVDLRQLERQWCEHLASL